MKNSDKKRRSRYFVIANLVIFLIGAIIVAVGLWIPNLAIQSVVLNIGSSISVVSILFFLGKFLLYDNQVDIAEQLEVFEKKLENRPLFVTRNQANSNKNFEQFVEGTKNLFIGGVALRSACRDHRGVLSDLLKKKAKLRVLILDPESTDIPLIAKEWGIPQETIKGDIKATLAILEELNNYSKQIRSGSLEVRISNREPVFSFISRDGNGVSARLRAELRVFGLDLSSRPVWELSAADSPWLQRFNQMCEALWESSEIVIS